MKTRHIPAIIWPAAILIPIILKAAEVITFRWIIILLPLILWIFLNVAYNVSVWIRRREERRIIDSGEEEAWEKSQERIRNKETEY